MSNDTAPDDTTYIEITEVKECLLIIRIVNFVKLCCLVFISDVLRHTGHVALMSKSQT